MKSRSKTMVIAATIAGLAAGSIAFAQTGADTKKPDQSQGVQEMMLGGTGMMPMMSMMSQMNEMTGTCNKVMQAMMPEVNKPTDEGKRPNNG